MASCSLVLFDSSTYLPCRSRRHRMPSVASQRGAQKRQEKMADIKSRMETVRALYRQNPSERLPEALKALKKAEEHFGFPFSKPAEGLPPTFSKNSSIATLLSWQA